MENNCLENLCSKDNSNPSQGPPAPSKEDLFTIDDLEMKFKKLKLDDDSEPEVTTGKRISEASIDQESTQSRMVQSQIHETQSEIPTFTQVKVIPTETEENPKSTRSTSTESTQSDKLSTQGNVSNEEDEEEESDYDAEDEEEDYEDEVDTEDEDESDCPEDSEYECEGVWNCRECRLCEHHADP